MYRACDVRASAASASKGQWVQTTELIDRNTGVTCTAPPLWDAVLGYASVDHWIVTGFEQVDSDGGSRVDFAQTWILTPANRRSGIQAVEYSRRRISGI